MATLEPHVPEVRTLSNFFSWCLEQKASQTLKMCIYVCVIFIKCLSTDAIPRQELVFIPPADIPLSLPGEDSVLLFLFIYRNKSKLCQAWKSYFVF